MAIVLTGANTPVVTGKLAGTVFQRVKGGRTIMRSKVVPRQHPRKQGLVPVLNQTGTSSHQKQLLVFLQRSWSTLTNEERSTWNDNAPDGLSGINLFVRYNSSLLANGLTYRSFPGNTPQLWVISSFTAERVSADGQYLIRATVVKRNDADLIPLYVSTPVTAGRKGAPQGWRFLQALSLEVGNNSQGVDPRSIGLPGNYFYNFAYRLNVSSPHSCGQYIPVQGI